MPLPLWALERLYKWVMFVMLSSFLRFVSMISRRLGCPQGNVVAQWGLVGGGAVATGLVQSWDVAVANSPCMPQRECSVKSCSESSCSFPLWQLC